MCGWEEYFTIQKNRGKNKLLAMYYINIAYITQFVSVKKKCSVFFTHIDLTYRYESHCSQRVEALLDNIQQKINKGCLYLFSEYR